MQENFLIIFSRAPALGKVKKRLAKDIGKEAALAIHNRLFQNTIDVVQKTEIPFAVFYSEQSKIASKHPSFIQKGEDLGKRMFNALTQLSHQSKKTCLIGSDCYDITSNDIAAAFKALNNCDIVIGPAADGGYYLIGMREPHPEIFMNISWGTSAVLEETINRCAEMDLKVSFISERNDVDTIADIPAGWL
jgi:rSAM/selenodomain-associated transferase 1